MQSSGTRPSANCGDCCPLCPTGVGTRGKFVLSSSGGGGGDKETCAGCPKQRYATGQLGKVQGRDRVGILERSCGYRARGVSIRGNSFYRRTWGTGRGGIAMWLNVVLTPG